MGCGNGPNHAIMKESRDFNTWTEVITEGSVKKGEKLVDEEILKLYHAASTQGTRPDG